MKKRTFPIFTIFALSLIVVTGCDKDDDNTPTPKTKTELVSQSTWVFSGAVVGTTDVSPLLQACQKDNTLTFVASGSGTLDEGASKCNMSDPQTNSFSWNFASAETVLHISTVLFSGGSSDFTLVSLSETTLVVSQDITVSGTTQTAIVTFIH